VRLPARHRHDGLKGRALGALKHGDDGGLSPGAPKGNKNALRHGRYTAEAQLIAAHNAAMECYRRAMIREQTFEGRRDSLSQGNKLSRTCASLIEALQKVTVEHVHVHSGGQAVVGVVAPTAALQSPEGRNAKQVAHAPQPPLRSEDPKREAVPVASDAERPLPDARRAVPRGSEGQQERP
jgi:hypothetical protein